MNRATVTICSTCRPAGFPDDAERPGAVFARAVRDEVLSRRLEDVVAVRAIACLSICTRACSATVAAPGKFAYALGDLVDADAPDLVTFAALHAESADGVPPWRARPEKIRKSVVSRTPPPDAEHPLVGDVA